MSDPTILVIHDDIFELRWVCRDGREGVVEKPEGFTDHDEVTRLVTGSIQAAGIVPNLSDMLYFSREPFEGEVAWY